MSLPKTRFGAICLLIFCVTYAWQIQNIPLLKFQMNSAFHARTMPEVLAVLGIILSLWLVIAPGDGERLNLREFNWPLGLAFLGLMSLYGFLVRPMGFLITTCLFLMIGFAMLGERNIWRLAAVSVPLVVIFWALMNYGLDVYVAPLPSFLRN